MREGRKICKEPRQDIGRGSERELSVQKKATSQFHKVAIKNVNKLALDKKETDNAAV